MALAHFPVVRVCCSVKKMYWPLQIQVCFNCWERSTVRQVRHTAGHGEGTINNVKQMFLFRLTRMCIRTGYNVKNHIF